MPSCAASSSRAPTPTARCTPRPASLDPRERAFAMALAYGTVQRVATLDHVLARLSEPAARAPGRAGAGRPAARPDAVALPPRDRRARRRPRVGRACQALVSAAGRDWSTPCCAARRVRAPPVLAGLDDRTPQAAAILHSVPVWLAELWWCRARRRARARAAGRRQPTGRIGAPDQYARRRSGDRGVAAERGEPARARHSRGRDPRRTVRCLRLATVGAGRDHAAGARLDGSSRRRSIPRPGIGCSTCAPPRAPRRRIWRR